MLTVLGNICIPECSDSRFTTVDQYRYFIWELTISKPYTVLSDNLLTGFRINYFRTWKIDAKLLCVTVSMYTDHNSDSLNQPQELLAMTIGSHLDCFEVLCAIVPISCRCYHQIMYPFLACLKINCPPFSHTPSCVFLRTAIISLQRVSCFYNREEWYLLDGAYGIFKYLPAPPPPIMDTVHWRCSRSWRHSCTV